MNYYERHLGDYAKDTGHLSLLEHGVYTLLLDRYYATEQGIPADQAHRVARARTDEERSAVDAVLNEFFRLEENVWVNGRVEEEIAKAKVRIESARQNGKKGGRPPKNNQDVTHAKPNGIFLGSENGTQQKAHQTPDTNISPSLRSGESARKRAPAVSRPDDVAEQTWDDWTALRKAKKAPVTETVLKQARAEARKAAMPLDAFLAVWCARGSQGLQADWLKPHERAGPALAGANPTASPPSKTLSAIQTLQGMKHGNRVDPQRDSGRFEPVALLEPGPDPGGGHDRWNGDGVVSGGY